jgi:CheY-like chemotaxis protein
MQQAAESAFDDPRTGRDCEILVVEDCADVADALVLVLEQYGYRTSAASNGKEAIAMLRTQRPRLVLVDLVMPVLSGLELIDAMKRDTALADIPVVAMTASALRPEGVCTVKKPFTIPGLLSAAKVFCDPAPPRDLRQ